MFYGNQYLGSVRIDGRKYSKTQIIGMKIANTIKKALLLSLVIVLGGWLVTAGIYIAKANIEPSKVYAKEIVEVPIYSIPPVMNRIAKCESGGVHYKNGQVIMRPNSNGTVDIGKFQINSVHNKQASKMNLDLTKEKDNEAFAMWMYHNEGTGPWYPSRTCWQ